MINSTLLGLAESHSSAPPRLSLETEMEGFHLPAPLLPVGRLGELR